MYQRAESHPPRDPNEPAPFSEEDVRLQISWCKIGKAPGSDNIPARVLKTCDMELSPVLHSLFCESYQSATIPNLWITATIIPVPQKNPAHRAHHYRPVSLTSIIMKCLENLLLHTVQPNVNNSPPPIFLQGQGIAPGTSAKIFFVVFCF